jgi:N-acyl-phosphatidylethanolamine-hydrolysing phospholipase D
MTQRTLPSIALGLLLLSGCMASRVLGRTLTSFREPRQLEHKLTTPMRPDARLAVLWVGHSTVLVQMDDRFILTDPVFTRTVGTVSPRLVEPGIEPANLPSKMLVVVSHPHFDHLSYDSLEMLEGKTEVLLVPPGVRENLPRYAFDSQELETWQTYEQGGLRVTAVPVRHGGGRFRIDNAWNPRAFTGYVFEYHGLSVYFGGDTIFDGQAFRATERRFAALDLAILPICPMQPRSFMRRAHMDPARALDAFTVLGAKRMMPIHFDTFVNSEDRPGECSLELLGEMSRRGIILGRIALLAIGEQQVLLAK